MFIFKEDSKETKKRAEVDYWCKGLGVKDLSFLIFIQIESVAEGILLIKIYFRSKCLSNPNNLY
jgi:hypothetical protein